MLSWLLTLNHKTPPSYPRFGLFAHPRALPTSTHLPRAVPCSADCHPTATHCHCPCCHHCSPISPLPPGLPPDCHPTATGTATHCPLPLPPDCHSLALIAPCHCHLTATHCPCPCHPTATHCHCPCHPTATHCPLPIARQSHHCHPTATRLPPDCHSLPLIAPAPCHLATATLPLPLTATHCHPHPSRLACACPRVPRCLRGDPRQGDPHAAHVCARVRRVDGAAAAGDRGRCGRRWRRRRRERALERRGGGVAGRGGGGPRAGAHRYGGDPTSFSFLIFLYIFLSSTAARVLMARAATLVRFGVV
jgi:hypothetical protein